MRVVTRFDRAAAGYDAAAGIQKEIAEALLDRIGDCQPCRILDIGCGTGLLTALAAARWPKAEITALDAAPAMLAEAKRKLPAVRFVQGDAANIPFPEKFDLVLSSMALHWLPAPGQVLEGWKRCVAAGGALHVALPVEGSLAEWERLCRSHDAPARLWPFPPHSEFAADHVLRHHHAEHADAHAFLHSMRQTGAHTPDPRRLAMSAATLRAILAAAPKPFAVHFRIAYLSWP